MTQSVLDKARDEGFAEARKRAEDEAEKERRAADKELKLASRTNNFNPLTIASTKVRRDTARRIATAIRKLK
jgi:hypothetical protein